MVITKLLKMKKIKIFYFLVLVMISSLSCTKSEKQEKDAGLILWYQSPASTWAEALPIGNGRIAAMCYGGTTTERFQINEESLWAGSQINPHAENYYENLQKIQKMVFAGEYAKAHDFGVENLTAIPTSFRSYEPFADLLVEFADQGAVSDYKRELDLSTGINRVSYSTADGNIIRESFVSAVDDILCIRFLSSGKGKISCNVGLQRFKDAAVKVLPSGEIEMDGQIVDDDSPEAFDDNPGKSGPGGKHMRFAGRLVAKVSDGDLQAGQDGLVVEDAREVVLLFTAATDYNLSLLNFDRSIDPGKRADGIIGKVSDKTWDELKDAHVKEHSAVFNRVNLDLGSSPNDSLPTDKRIEVFENGAEDNGLMVQFFQFGRYLLMNSSRGPAALPANLQGKWSEREWAPWEADYHLNVNLQMNYWPSDVTSLSETNIPLINWFEQIAKISEPYAKSMFNANGWFSCLAANPFGRVTPSASTPSSQFINGVLDPLAGAWMVMNLWDHYEYTQDNSFLKEKLFPLLKGASGFILDVLVTGPDGNLHFVPSASPKNSYVDKETGRKIRITATSTYHLSVIRAIFDATREASEILQLNDPVIDRIAKAEIILPPFPVDKDGKLMEWREGFEEAEPGHRHLSPLLCIHPFASITPENPELFNAARKLLDWRKENGQGSGGGWSGAHSAIMYSWFYDGERAYNGLATLLNSLDGTLLNARRIFQIDANFGATSLVAEMLIQSQLKDENGNFIIHLLPALPKEWSSGSFKGLCARGGYTVDLEWKDNEIISAVITAKKEGDCKVRFRDKTVELSFKEGEKRELTSF